MSNGERLFEAIDLISGPLVDEAAEYRFKKDRFIPRVLAAAAAVVRLGCAAFAVTKLINKPAPEQSAAMPTEAAETPVPTPDISAMRIVYGRNKEGSLSVDINAYERGEVYVMGSLRDALVDPENTDCLFAVDIKFLYTADEEIDKASAERWARYDAAVSDPDYIELEETFREWRVDHISTFDPDEYREWEELQNRIGGVGLDCLYESYFSHLIEAGQGAKAETYRNAASAVKDAWAEIMNKEFTAETKRIFDEEAQRLIDMGLCIDISSLNMAGHTYRAYLTEEQIRAFPADKAKAYIISFAGESYSEILSID